MLIFVLILFLVALLISIAWFYNALVQARTMLAEAWSGIDVQLKLRHDLVPNLVAIVKGYGSHELETFESVVQHRSQGGQAASYQEATAVSGAERELTSVLGKIFAISEAYPNLKADTSFLNLQHKLVEIEDQIQYARRYYNGCVRDFNLRVEQVPSSLVAGLFNFKKAEFFELEHLEIRNNPEVSFVQK
jgi:LemA protein